MPQGDPLIFYASVMHVHVKASRSGRLQYVADINEVTIKTGNGSTPVDTFGAQSKKGGLAGFTRGPVHSVINFKSATRIEGTPEFDWLDAITNYTLLTLKGYIMGDTSGKKRMYEGMPISSDENFGLGKPAMNDIQIHCGPPVVDKK